MPVIEVPRTAQLVVSGFVLGQPWTNVIGVRSATADAIDEESVIDLAVAVRDLYDSWSNLLCNEWTLDALVVQDIEQSTRPAWDAPMAQLTGTDSTNPLPPNAAVVVSHSTGLRGRSFRGRTYLSGFTVDSIDGSGTISSARQTAILAGWDTFRSDLGAIAPVAFEHVVISRRLEVATTVVNSTMDGELDHQDRRKRA